MHPLDLPEAYKLAFSIVIGMLYGVVFCKSGFADPVAVKNALRLRNGRLIKTVLLALGLGTALFFFARRLGLVEVQVHRGYLWGSLFGGVFSGVGFVEHWRDGFGDSFCQCHHRLSEQYGLQLAPVGESAGAEEIF